MEEPEDEASASAAGPVPEPLPIISYCCVLFYARFQILQGNFAYNFLYEYVWIPNFPGRPATLTMTVHTQRSLPHLCRTTLRTTL